MDRNKLIEYIKMGVPKTRIAEHLGISKRTLYYYLAKNPISEKELKDKNTLLNDLRNVEIKAESIGSDKPGNFRFNEDDMKHFKE